MLSELAILNCTKSVHRILSVHGGCYSKIILNWKIDCLQLRFCLVFCNVANESIIQKRHDKRIDPILNVASLDTQNVKVFNTQSDQKGKHPTHN